MDLVTPSSTAGKRITAKKQIKCKKIEDFFSRINEPYEAQSPGIMPRMGSEPASMRAGASLQELDTGEELPSQGSPHLGCKLKTQRSDPDAARKEST